MRVIIAVGDEGEKCDECEKFSKLFVDFGGPDENKLSVEICERCLVVALKEIRKRKLRKKVQNDIPNRDCQNTP